MKPLALATFACALALTACGAEAEPPAPADHRLEPPDENGFQLTTGLFSVAPGEEVQDCYFFEVPSDTPLFVDHIAFALNPGSHHMNVFRVNTIKGLGGAPGEVVRGGECWKGPNWSDWPLVANNQNDGQGDWQLPAGVAIRFEPRELLMLQSHYVNTAVQPTPGDARATVNFYGTPEAAVQHELGTVFATNQQIQVCPGQSHVQYTATCTFSSAEPVTIVAANGHFHSRGERFGIAPFDPFSGAGEDFYESRTWDEPPFLRDLSVAVPQDGGFAYTCEFSAAPDDCGDPAKECCFTFGGNVDMQEHCNAFVYYYPRGNTDVNCF